MPWCYLWVDRCQYQKVFYNCINVVCYDDVHIHHARKRADTGGEKVRIEHTMPTDETLVLKRGYLSKQTMSSAGVIYRKRTVVVTAECIYFGKTDTGGVLDCVPLLQIEQQSLSEVKQPDQNCPKAAVPWNRKESETFDESKSIPKSA
jgi:hypothetical protein